jgi:protein TonB
MKIKSILSLFIALSFLMAPMSQVSAQEKSKKEVFEKVEVMPKFQGKDVKHFKQWVTSQIKYPKKALKEGISGKVYANFVIASDGKVVDVEIKKGVHELLDKEVLRVVKSSPKWTPGMNKGKAVDVAIVIPVEFKLS